MAVTGIAREARIAAGDGVVAFVGGGDPAALGDRLERHLLTPGPGDPAARATRGIVSFGLAGALAEGLDVGDWIVAERLIGTIELECDPRWRECLLARLPGAVSGTVYADGLMAADLVAKHALERRTGALAVDMESHVAARVARHHNLPFAILRVISDRADQMLPPAFAVSMTADGGIDARAMLRSVVAQPRQLPRLIGAMADGAAALAALRRGRLLLGGGLGFPDLGDLALDIA